MFVNRGGLITTRRTIQWKKIVMKSGLVLNFNYSLIKNKDSCFLPFLCRSHFRAFSVSYKNV